MPFFYASESREGGKLLVISCRDIIFLLVPGAEPVIGFDALLLRRAPPGYFCDCCRFLRLLLLLVVVVVVAPCRLRSAIDHPFMTGLLMSVFIVGPCGRRSISLS